MSKQNGYSFSQDAALKKEASLEWENSEVAFVDPEVSYDFVKRNVQAEIAKIRSDSFNNAKPSN